ncbi:ABC transporter ATP-binding protein [Helcobacillus massiliensis]|uniref:ABC-2 type transport system ATP-binding protein n=1 Tax=Helcobacillus massiliensis TaxID=521392 RepID=A0A839QVS9_9MICO|nr:ABC transporter ATP-binding protein [Helcobacillus massiliensis]MBB3022880.1 ABC-2 type transport system ATP-binding protein [Helcobacillus massiliensis]
MTDAALQMQGLQKSFAGVPVVHDLSLSIPRGSLYAIVGPNGAGKTTALSMATGLLRPDAGTALILGTDVWQQPTEAKRQVGVLADGLPVFDRLTGRELLTYTGLIRGIDPATVEQRTDSLLATLGLADAEGKLIVDYSAGMTKKILLANALLHAPRLLVLDEPLEAVDPVSAQTIRSVLSSYVASGGTVVISSHVMELVEGLCSHVAIITDGAVRTAGTLDEVRAGGTLQERFLELAGGQASQGDLSWLNQ